jgi:hypothetical protein
MITPFVFTGFFQDTVTDVDDVFLADNDWTTSGADITRNVHM